MSVDSIKVSLTDLCIKGGQYDKADSEIRQIAKCTSIKEKRLNFAQNYRITNVVLSAFSLLAILPLTLAWTAGMILVAPTGGGKGSISEDYQKMSARIWQWIRPTFSEKNLNKSIEIDRSILRIKIAEISNGQARLVVHPKQ